MGPKRIPSSFTSKAVLEGKYIFGASGSKLSATKLPQAESAQSTHLPARPQTTTRTASSASAHPHSKHQQSHHHQKSRAPRNSKARAASSSSNASSTSSAAGGLKKASKAVSNSAARKVQSDNPTVLMCVPKTVAAKVKVIPSKGEGGGKESASKVGGHNSNLRVDSAAPTAMIAPEDYKHLYAAIKGKEIIKVVVPKAVKGGQSDSLATPGITSEAPTALIAPQDYDHIYCAEPTPPKMAVSKQSKNKVQAKSSFKVKGQGDKRIPSDAPTALIEAVAKQDAEKEQTKMVMEAKMVAGKTKAKGGGQTSFKPASAQVVNQLTIGKQGQPNNNTAQKQPQEHAKESSAKHSEANKDEDEDSGLGCCLIF